MSQVGHRKLFFLRGWQSGKSQGRFEQIHAVRTAINSSKEPLGGGARLGVQHTPHGQPEECMGQYKHQPCLSWTFTNC